MNTAIKNETRTIPVLETVIPFMGFYESIISAEIDSVLEREAEYMADCEDLTFIEGASVADICEALSDAIDYQGLRKAIALDYVDAFAEFLGELWLEGSPLTFKSLKSPREYNFSTDIITAEINVAAVETMFKVLSEDGFKDLKRVIEERHTSRSGFASFYSNDINVWLASPVAEWDKNELETLIIAFCNSYGFDVSNGISDTRYFEDALSKISERVGEFSEPNPLKNLIVTDA